MRASSVPNLYAFCLNKRSCIFVRTGRPLLLILRFCGLSFGAARRSFTAVHAVPKMGPPGGPIFGTVFRFILVSFLHQG